MRHEVSRRVVLLLAVGALGLAMTPTMVVAQSAKKPSAKPTPKKESPKDLTGADVLVLRDGKTLLGQIYDPSPKGTYIVLVRRAWAEANVPAWLDKWKSGEKGANDAAERQRRERLTIWRRDRLVPPGSVAPDDRITQWLDRELAKPAGQSEPSVLMTVPPGTWRREERRSPWNGRGAGAAVWVDPRVQ